MVPSRLIIKKSKGRRYRRRAGVSRSGGAVCVDGVRGSGREINPVTRAPAIFIIKF